MREVRLYRGEAVMRTIYIPKDMDEALRRLAFAMNTTKSEIMREAIAERLANTRITVTVNREGN